MIFQKKVKKIPMKEIKEIVPAYEKIYYVSNDGLYFASKENCLSWENRNLSKEAFQDKYFSMDSYDDNFSLVSTECWFLLDEKECNPNCLISFITHHLNIRLSDYRKKYILEHCNFIISSEKANEFHLVGILFSFNEDKSVKSAKFLNLERAIELNSRNLNFCKSKEIKYHALSNMINSANKNLYHDLSHTSTDN